MTTVKKITVPMSMRFPNIPGICNLLINSFISLGIDPPLNIVALSLNLDK